MTSRLFEWRWAAFGAAVTIASGCGGRIALPELYHPGPAGYQRARAIQNDPYPLDDVAEPVVGGRPREYQRPVPEPERAVQYDQRHAQAAGVAPAPATFAPAPVGPPQPLPYQYTAPPVTTSPPPAPYQLSVPAQPVAPAPYPYGSPKPISPSPVPQFRPPY